jgi:uridine kinase
MNCDLVAAEIKKNSDYPVLIDIEGFGGSGKTTFAGKLGKVLGNTYIVHIDDFIIKEKLGEKYRV